MIQGYKYYPNHTSAEWITFPIDHNVVEFESTMGYSDIGNESQESFINNHCSQKWVMELHDIYQQFVDKDRLTIGIGSGYGEHELLLHLKGYTILASDIIPGLTQKTADLFPGFRAYTIDIFKDNLKEIPDAGDSKVTTFDILVSGLDSYFDDNTTMILFQKIGENLDKGSACIFTLRYPDSFTRRLVEFCLFSEALINYHIRKRGIIQKKHGYRRTAREICSMATRSGFILEKMHPAMLGCECSRSRILGKVVPLCRAVDAVIPLFTCAYVFKFRKIS